MRMAISRLSSEVSVLGSRDGVTIGPGGDVDLDRIIGEMPDVRDGDTVVTPARPLTIAEALGAELLVSFEIVGSQAAAEPAAADAAPGRRRRSAEERE